MNTEQERAEFEAWWKDRQPAVSIKEDAFAAYQTGRAALQSKDREDNGEWMRRFIELLDEFGDESARYAHPCETDRSWLDKIRADIIDHARRIEGDGVANTSHGARCLSETE